MRQRARWCTVLVGVSLVACGTGPAPILPDGGDGGVATDGGRRRIVWPAPVLELEDALDPTLVQSPAGEQTLVYVQAGKLWAHRAPPAGAAVELALAQGAAGAVSVAASPTSDRVFVATGNIGVSLTAGVPDGPAFPTYGGLASLSGLGAGWVDGQPVVSALTGEVSYGSTIYPASFLAFRVPLDQPGSLPLPEPGSGERVESPGNAYHHYDEAHRFVDLGDGTALLLRTHWRSDAVDPTNGKAYAEWHVLAPKAGTTGRAANFLVPRRSGRLELPGPAAWIQPQALGAGRYALTWASTTDALVYDVFVAGLAIAADGTPSLTTAPVNVSRTSGLTANSDHLLVLPTGEGRLWAVWRETAGGPMVALLDEADFHVLEYGGPPEELTCNLSSSLGAVVDGQGTLHLAAGFLPVVTITDPQGTREEGRLFVRLFELRLP